MKHVILIEDRVNRQDLFIKRIDENILSATNLKNIAGGDDFVNYASKIKAKDLVALQDFDAIIIHRSAFEQNERQILIDYCRTNNKSLVFFSGGISSSIYSESLGFPLISLNSNTLYSTNLNTFLTGAKEGKINLLLLAFGNKWKLNYMLNYELLLSSLLLDPELNSKLPSAILKDKLKLPKVISEHFQEEGYSIDWLEDNLIENPKGHVVQLHKRLSSSISNIIAFS